VVAGWICFVRSSPADYYVESIPALHQSPDCPGLLCHLRLTNRPASRFGLEKTEGEGAVLWTRKEEEIVDLLWTVAVILVILWLVELASSYTLGGFIHILLVLAIVMVLIRVIQGRRPVA
jgi:hypothetical protein